MGADWIADYRASVSRGDQIHADRVPSTGERCCWFPYNGGRHYTSPGWLGAGLAESLARAIRCRAATGAETSVLFLDQQATDYQVEEALWESTRAGVDCEFREVQPQELYYELLERLSEGGVSEEALRRLQSD